MIKTEFSWGEKVKVTGNIQRQRSGNTRKWLSFKHAPIEAIFLIGINLANGTCEYNTYEEDGKYYFAPDKLIPGAWIHEKNRAPRKVFLSMIEKIS